MPLEPPLLKLRAKKRKHLRSVWEVQLNCSLLSMNSYRLRAAQIQRVRARAPWKRRKHENKTSFILKHLLKYWKVILPHTKSKSHFLKSETEQSAHRQTTKSETMVSASRLLLWTQSPLFKCPVCRLTLMSNWSQVGADGSTCAGVSSLANELSFTPVS